MRTLRRGKTYCLRWHEDGGRVPTEAVGPDRGLTEQLRNDRERRLNAGQLRAAAKVTYEEFEAEGLAVLRGRLAPSALVEVRPTSRLLRESCGATPLSRISSRMVERFFSRRLQQVRPAAANKDLRTLKALLNRAVGRGCLERDPTAGLKQVREPENDRRALTCEEVSRLFLASASATWRMLIALAVTTGMRRREAAALRWEDVDLSTGTAWVRNRHERPTKSRKSRERFLIPEVCGLLRRLSREGDFVFATRDGRPLANNVWRDFQEIVKKAGIKRCSIQDLRRTFASQLAMAGVNQAVVQKLVGHASISTTCKYYTNVLPPALRSAQAALPFGGVIRDVSYPYHAVVRREKGSPSRRRRPERQERRRRAVKELRRHSDVACQDAPVAQSDRASDF